MIPSKQACYVSHNGQEIFKPHFEYLAGSGFNWISSSNGHAPDGAVSSGNTASGETLYIGRAHHEGSVTPGKIHGSHGCLYFPYGGGEQSTLYYEVLCGKKKADWQAVSAHDALPQHAIYAGNDCDGSAIYVGRAHHEGELLPAKVIPSKNVAYSKLEIVTSRTFFNFYYFLVSWGGQEIPKYHYDILCNGNVHWIPSQHGASHPNAVLGGHTSSGESLFIGRAHHQGSITPGKIHPSHQTLYLPFGGDEVAISNYEILVEY